MLLEPKPLKNAGNYKRDKAENKLGKVPQIKCDHIHPSQFEPQVGHSIIQRHLCYAYHCLIFFFIIPPHRSHFNSSSLSTRNLLFLLFNSCRSGSSKFQNPFCFFRLLGPTSLHSDLVHLICVPLLLHSLPSPLKLLLVVKLRIDSLWPIVHFSFFDNTSNR